MTKVVVMALFLVLIYFIWRIGLFITAWLGEKVLTFSPRFPYSDIYLIPSGLPHWFWSLANFDGVHYLTIAANGYAAQFTQVFFPLYPMILGFLQKFFSFLNPVFIGLLISNTFFLLSLIVIYKLLLLDYKIDTIKWIILILITFPTSFFFGALYTESFFLFIVLASLYAARKKRWMVASMLGAAASATRLFGIFLLPALWWELYKSKASKSQSFKETILRVVSTVFFSPLSLISSGLLSYMLYLQVNFGDFLYFWHNQPVFGAQREGSGIILLPQVFWRYLKILTSLPVTSEMYWISALELFSTLFAFILLYFAYKNKVRTSYLIFSFLSIVTPTLTGTLSSMPRYILVAFPIFIALGMLKSNLIKSAIIIVSAITLLILTILFTAGHWVS